MGGGGGGGEDRQTDGVQLSLGTALRDTAGEMHRAAGGTHLEEKGFRGLPLGTPQWGEWTLDSCHVAWQKMGGIDTPATTCCMA